MLRHRLAPVLLAGAAMLAAMPGAYGEPATPKPALASAARAADISLLIAEGDKRAAGGDLYGAIESYAAARRTAPSDLLAAGRLGIVLAEQGRHAEALPHLEEAERAEPPEMAAIRSLINALLALERPMEASLRLTRALMLAPDDARLWNAAGIAADLTGDAGGAAVAYRNGLAAAPDNQSLKINLALSRFAAGDQAGATAAATVAGLSMTEVEGRAKRLMAYRDRTRARLAVASRQSAGNLPEAPPMVALALPPVQVRELPPAPMPAAAIAAVAPAPEAAPSPAPAAVTEAAAAPETMPVAAAPDPVAMPAAPEATGSEPAGADLVASAAATEPAALPEAPAENPPPAEAPVAEAPRADVAAAAPASADPVPQAAAGEVKAEPPVPAAPSDAPAAAAPATPTTAPTTWTQPGGHLVQIAAYGRASLAEAQWQKMKTDHAAVLEGTEPVIQRADLGEKGVVYRLRIVVADRAAAAGLCERLHGVGLDCVAIPSPTPVAQKISSIVPIQ